MLKYLAALLALTIVFLVTGAPSTHSTEVPTTAVSDLERQAVVVGIVMGIDLALANEGLPAMDRENWLRFAGIFDAATAGCTTVQCITERIVKLRASLMNKSGKHPDPLPPTEKKLLL